MPVTGCVTVSLPLSGGANVIYVDSVIIRLNKFGSRGHLEFPMVSVHSDLGHEVQEEEIDKRRGVYGYFMWGFGADGPPAAISWIEGGFINWKETIWVPDRTINRPTHFRIWTRKGVEGDWVCKEGNPALAPRNLVLTP